MESFNFIFRYKLKTILAKVVLVSFVYSTFGFLAVHPILSTYYKYLGIEEANNPSNEELVELLIFDKKKIISGELNFRWIHSREFKYNGDMYDIVIKEETEKELIVLVINDTKEEKLEEEFEKRIHKNSTENKHLPLVIKYSLSISEAVQSFRVGFTLEYQSSFDCQINNLYKSIYFDTPSPPPRLV
ncbi:MAG: hypothetical protein DAHOPDDO_01712 [Ignavibacteriaceae bacterium]|nr:hypothetical protein [Ignavibacteriaceae bacterium]